MSNFTKLAIGALAVFAVLYLVPLMIKLMIGGAAVIAGLAYLTGHGSSIMSWATSAWAWARGWYSRFIG